MKKNITQADIAKEANVSRELVSIVLNGKDIDKKRCRPDVRNRILEIASKYNYRTNRSAAFMKNKRHGSLGFLVSDFGQIQHDLFAQIVPESKHHDYALMLEQLPDNLKDRIMLLDDYVVDGLIVFSELPQEIMERIKRIQEPVLYFNTNKREGHNVITIADETAGYNAVKALAEAGRSKIAYICWADTNPKHYSVQDRKKGVLAGCKEFGLDFVTDIYIENIAHSSDNMLMVAEIIQDKIKNIDLDGIVLHSDLVAPAFYNVASNLNKSIPKDYSVISFNNSIISHMVAPRLTSLGLENETVANLIITRLLDLINGKKDLSTIKVELKIFSRSSI